MTRKLITASTPTTVQAVIDGRITAANATARTITGLAVPWGETGRTNLGRARFARGSLTASTPGDIRLLVEHDVERPIGVGTSVQDTDQGLMCTFTLPAGALGDQILAAAASGLRNGLSVGALVDEATTGDDGVLDVIRASFQEVSVVTLPAMAGARVSQVAASQPAAPVLPAPAPAPAAAPALPVLPYGSVITARQPMTVEQAVDRIVAGFRSGGPEAAIRAALTDIVPPAAGASRDAIFRPQWLGELWQAERVDRPLVDSISSGRLTSFTVTGFQVVRPPFGVAPYPGGKTAVPSPGTYTVTPVSATAQRIAGAHDIDRIFLDLGDASFMTSYFRFQAQNYSVLTEEQTGTALLAAATDLAASADALAGIVLVAQSLAAIGAKTSFVACAPDVFASLLAIKDSDKPWLFSSASANVGEQTSTVAGVGPFANTALPPGTILAGDKRAATFYEWKNPPLTVSAVSIGNGGIDLGVFGYTALIVNDPAALVTTAIPVVP